MEASCEVTASGTWEAGSAVALDNRNYSCLACLGMIARLCEGAFGIEELQMRASRYWADLWQRSD